MVDLHCHILPGVDDGAADVSATCAMARHALATGCRAVVASSHLWEGIFLATPEMLRKEYDNAVRALRREGIELEIIPGAENFLGDVTPEEFAEKAVPLGTEGRYVLMDFSLRSVPRHLVDTVRALRSRKRVALVAHPERNREIQADPRPVADWIAAGALVQVNAGSVLGWLGSEAHDTARRLLESGAVHVLASDAHGRHRPFCLGEGREVAAAIVGAEEADRMTREWPWRVVRGEDVEVKPPAPLSRGGKRIWRRLWDG